MGDWISETARARRLLAIVVLIAFLLVGLVALDAACGKKKEVPEPVTTSGGVATTASPAAEKEEPPSIRETAAPGEASFAAVKNPFDARLDDRGRIWILDSTDSRLRLFDHDGGFLGGWGGLGDGKFSFRHPEGLAIRSQKVYVADTWNGRIEVFTLKGQWVASTVGLYGPRGVAVAPDGTVWVTDTGHGSILVYDAALQRARTVGKPGSARGEFDGPVGIAITPSGTVYISDAGNGRIQVLDKDGNFVSSWSVPWLKKSWQARLATGPNDRVYLSNPEASEVLSFSSSGAPGRRWDADDSGQKFLRPVGLEVDRRQGVLYVVDTAIHKVLKVRLSGK